MLPERVNVFSFYSFNEGVIFRVYNKVNNPKAKTKNKTMNTELNQDMNKHL